MRRRLRVPRSVRGLVTRRVLVMEYLDGIPVRISGLSREGLYMHREALTRDSSLPLADHAAA
jgi:predicted unusual protein kinase regulating ubiquinone biosynthesis (AarF/ABC1/UbiB family)